MDTFLFFLPIATALAVTVLRCSELSAKRDVVAGQVAETTTLRLLVINGFAVLLIALLEYILRGKSLAPIPYGIGIACAVASFAIRRRAIAALGRFWSLHVEMRDNHEMVTDGPFKWVRHPTYLSMIFEILTMVFLLNSYYALILVPALFVPTMIMRIRLEEKALIAQFGDGYRNYMRTTPAVIPWKFPKS